MQQIQPVNAGTQSRPCSTCWDAHFLKMNAAWKIWQLLMRRLSTVQEPGQTYDSVQGWWTRKKDLEKGHFLGVRNGGGGGKCKWKCPPPPGSAALVLNNHGLAQNLLCMTRPSSPQHFFFCGASLPTGSPQLCRRSRSLLPQAERSLDRMKLVQSSYHS